MGSKFVRTILSSFALGAAVGAGAAVLRHQRARRNPYSLSDQKRINRSLDQTLASARLTATILLGAEHRYVIFSDHHKGGGDQADDFRHCRKTYLAALNYYNQQEFTLIILGDAEELWEESIPRVMRTYPDVFASEQRFYPARYLRVFGNHDNAWQIDFNVRLYLDKYFPGIQIYPALLLSYQEGTHNRGELFLAHGHQGTLDADVFGFLPPLVLPLYRQLQNITGIGHTSPSRNECLTGEHDTMMYRWASQKEKLLLIAGHTHRPVWSSRTHLDKLLYQLSNLLQLKPHQQPPDYEEQVAQLQAEIKIREEKSPPCNDTIKTRPGYFNTGCCRFADGDITGIELQDGELRLVKWGEQQGEMTRTELEKAHLSEIFAQL